MAKNDGGPAFPHPQAGVSHFNDPAAYMGMTLRDWFAGQAVSGMNNLSWEVAAERAYRVADAMLAYRDAKKEV